MNGPAALSLHFTQSRVRLECDHSKLRSLRAKPMMWLKFVLLPVFTEPDLDDLVPGKRVIEHSGDEQVVTTGKLFQFERAGLEVVIVDLRFYRAATF